MPTVYEHFDFTLLDDAEFREDSVREELVVPLLRALGYSAAAPYRIIRSKKLDHPFVYFGTVRKGISIIPDYLLEKDGKYAWILDAKSPNENIDTGKNVEQAYSYAMHRDIRVPIYALCNGRKLTVFHIQYEKPLFDVALSGIESVWTGLLTVLGCRSAWPQGRRPDFGLDLGLALTKAGLTEDATGKRTMQMFMGLPVWFIGRVKDGLYTIASYCSDVPMLDAPEGTKYAMSFDFGEQEYQQLLATLDDTSCEKVRTALSHQPFKLAFDSTPFAPAITVAARLGEHVYTNQNESYRPFIAEKFI
jgi:Type I restriction enzyme R protein N terminus (HSDR_N)